METAEQLTQQDRIVCTYQLTRCVKLQLVKSPDTIRKTTTFVSAIPQAIAGAGLALLLYALISAVVPQHMLRFLALTCGMAGWVYIGLAVVSKSWYTVLFFLLSGFVVFGTGIAGLHISGSYLLAGMLMNAALPLLPMMLAQNRSLLPPGPMTGWGIFYLVMTLILVKYMLA